MDLGEKVSQQTDDQSSKFMWFTKESHMKDGYIHLSIKQPLMKSCKLSNECKRHMQRQVEHRKHINVLISEKLLKKLNAARQNVIQYQIYTTSMHNVTKIRFF